MAHATGWTIDEIGQLTFRQIHELLPALNQAISGEEEEETLDYWEACKLAGIEPQPDGSYKKLF